MEAQHGQEASATFSVFTLGPEYEGYRISTLGTYRGNAGKYYIRKFHIKNMHNNMTTL